MPRGVQAEARCTTGHGQEVGGTGGGGTALVGNGTSRGRGGDSKKMPPDSSADDSPHRPAPQVMTEIETTF